VSKKTKSSKSLYEIISYDMQGIKIFDHTPNAKCLVNISITPNPAEPEPKLVF